MCKSEVWGGGWGGADCGTGPQAEHMALCGSALLKANDNKAVLYMVQLQSEVCEFTISNQGICVRNCSVNKS